MGDRNISLIYYSSLFQQHKLLRQQVKRKMKYFFISYIFQLTVEYLSYIAHNLFSILHSIVQTLHHLLFKSLKQLLPSLKSLALTSHASLTKSVSLLLHFARTRETHIPSTLHYWKFIRHKLLEMGA